MVKRAHAALATVAVGVVAISGLAACSSTSGGSGSDGGKHMLGIVQFSGSDVFSDAALAAGGDYAKKKGWTVQVVDANGSVDQMNAGMTNLVTKGASALLVSVFPSSALAAGIASAKQADVPIANWGGGTASGVQFAGAVDQDDASKQMVKDMGGKGEILTLGYRAGLPCQLREAGLDKVLKGTSIEQTKQQITIPGQVESASAATSAWAAAHPAGSTPLAVWACFDDPATGAASALHDLGRTDVKVYGVNGTKAAVDLVKSGGITATQWNNAPKQGRQLVQLEMEYIKDKKSVKYPQMVPAEVKVVTKDNVDAFLATNPTLY